jgi:hypothetical protein
MSLAFAGDVAPCRDHPEVASTGPCQRCGRHLCEVCAFQLGVARLCPDCATAGPSVQERSRVFSGGILSVGLAVAGFAVVGLIVLAAGAGIDIDPVVDRVGTTGALLAGAGGLAAGMSSRDGARRTGSVVPMVGLVASGLLVAVVLTLSVLALTAQ